MSPPPDSSPDVGGDLDPSQLPPGTRLGNYVVGQKLGRGGMGAVYLAERDGRPYAVKLSRRRLSDLSDGEREQVESRIRREISILWAVAHPNVVRIHAADRWPAMDGYLYLVTDYVAGTTLYRWAKERQPSLRQLCETFIALCEGVATLHKALFIHRDLKSDNVLVDESGRPVIIDFGIARQRNSYTLTATSSILGTSDYLSPEYCRFILEARGAKGERYEYRPGDDLHAVGYMLYHCLSGRPPFAPHDDDEWQLLKEIAQTVPPTPRSLGAAIPEGLDALVMRLLAKDPTVRFQSAGEVADGFEALLSSGGDAWDAPFVPPAAAQDRPTANLRRPGSGSRSRSRSGSRSGAGAAPAPASVPSAAAASESGVFVPSVDGNGQAAAVAPAVVSFSDERVAFVDSRDGAPVAHSPVKAEPGLPTAIREAAKMLDSGGRGRSRWPVALAGAAGAALLLVAVALLRPAAPAPRSLLSEHSEGAAPAADALAATVTASAPVAAVPEPQPAEVPRPPSATTTEKPAASEATRPRKASPAQQPSPSAEVAAVTSAEPVRRNLLRNTAMGAGAGAAPKASAPLGVTRGQLLAARLTVPVDPAVPGTVTAVLTADVVVGGKVVVRKGARVIGAQAMTTGTNRIALSWDSLEVAGLGAVAIQGTAYGTDKKPGLALRQVGGATATSDAQEAALGVAERLATQAVGQGAAGEVGRGVVEAGGRSARRGMTSSGAEGYAPVPSGAAFYVFVEQPF